MGLDFKKPKRPKKRKWAWLSVGFIILLATILISKVSADPARLTGTVSRVIDGDTFKLDGLEPSIRIWGLDAPERDEAAGPNATSTLTKILGSYSLTCIIRDIDKYQRIVGQCFLPDGTDIAAVMISRGAAREYCYFSSNAYGTC